MRRTGKITMGTCEECKKDGRVMPHITGFFWWKVTKLLCFYCGWSHVTKPKKTDKK